MQMPSAPERGALVITPKVFHSKAKGRRSSGAPWVTNNHHQSNPNGVSQVIHATNHVEPRWGSYHVSWESLPRVRRHAATLSFGV